MELKNSIKTRNGCRDCWNAYMARGAIFDKGDIPYCPTTSVTVPNSMVTWQEALEIYKKQIKRDKTFMCESYVCFYQDDYKFDGLNGVWSKPQKALKIIRHFGGMITPDFSTYQDFPEPIKVYATYRMRLLGYWFGQKGIKIINNIRWGTSETFKYSFNGVEKNSIVSIGTVGGSPRKKVDRARFEQGFYEMIDVLKPHTILVYGSANYECFEQAKTRGIAIYSYDSCTSSYFKKRGERYE